MKSLEKHRNIILLAVSVITVFLFVFISNRVSPFLIDNDNFLLKTLASGEVTGNPENHLYFIGMVVGSIISGLYNITGNGFPWFGMLLIGSIAAVLIFIIYFALANCRNIYSTLFIIFISILILISFFYRFFAETQFTITSGIVGAGALFALLMINMNISPRNNLVSIVFFFIFSLLSFSIRKHGFIMLFPFIGVIFISKFLDLFLPHFNRDDRPRKNFNTIFFVFVTLIISLGINTLCDYIGYNSYEWKQYDSFSQNRAAIVDYSGFPGYEESEKLYQELGIKQSSYIAISQHYNLLLDSNFNTNSMASLANSSKELRRSATQPFFYALKDLTLKIINRNLIDYTDRPVNLLVFWMYFCLVIIGLLSRKYRMLLDILFIIIARMFDWIYLVYNGRYPFRVTQIIFIAELFCLIGIAINYKIWELPVITFKKKTFRPLTALLFIGIIGISIRFGIPVVKDVKYSTVAFGDLSTSFVELEAYLEDHPDNFYYLEMSNLHYREKTLDTRVRPYENYIYMGSWVVNSPWYNHKLKRHGITDPAQAIINRDDIFIIYQVTDLYSRDYLDDFFDEHYPGTVVEKVDELVTSNGFVYEFLSVHQ